MMFPTQAELCLEVGMRVEVLEGEEVISEGLIGRMWSNLLNKNEEIELEDFTLCPGEKVSFVFTSHAKSEQHGWRVLFDDPFGDGRCYNPTAPAYRIRSKDAA